MLKKIFLKIILFVCFVLIFLILLEISLGFMGKIVILFRQHNIEKTNTDNVSIVCFGDSYTFGGLGLKSTSYPSYLNDLCKFANVENRGVCEYNSTQVLNNIKKYIETNNIPDILIVLVGSSNKYNCYGMNKINFYQKFRIYKIFQIIKLSIKNKMLKKSLEDSFIYDYMSGYYLCSDLQNINNDLKKLDYTYGVIEEINCYIAKLYARDDSTKKQDIENKIKELLSTLNKEQKQSNLYSFYNIYSFLDDKQQKQYYYNLIYQKNPQEAKNIKTENLLKYYYNNYRNLDDNEKIKIFNEIIDINPKVGYENLLYFYINKRLPYVKDKNNRDKIIKAIEENMDKYFVYETNAIEQNKMRILYYINKFDFDKAVLLYKQELENKDTEFDRFFHAKIAYSFVYCNRFSDAVYHFLQYFKFENNDNIGKNVGYYFMKSFDLQNKYSADFILKNFDEILEYKKQLKDSMFVQYLYKVLNEKRKFETDVIEWLKRDLNEIISLCEKNNIKLIFQTYPFSYNSVNDTIREICNNNKNLILVDQNNIFQELVKKDSSDLYFVDFDHCTEKGHYIMAENVYHALLENKLIRE